VREHRNDVYVRQARAAGYRSRAAYKLIEIDKRDRVLRRGGVVLDLGAAPGGWTQVAAARVGSAGKVIAVDLLPIAPVANVEIVHGDFLQRSVVEEVIKLLDGTKATLVMSDMAPNMSGMRALDQPRSLHLAEQVLAFAGEVCAPGASLLLKVFQGTGIEGFKRDLRGHFGRVCVRKPASSRSRSRELYLLARHYHV